MSGPPRLRLLLGLGLAWLTLAGHLRKSEIVREVPSNPQPPARAECPSWTGGALEGGWEAVALQTQPSTPSRADRLAACAEFCGANSASSSGLSAGLPAGGAALLCAYEERPSAGRCSVLVASESGIAVAGGSYACLLAPAAAQATLEVAGAEEVPVQSADDNSPEAPSPEVDHSRVAEAELLEVYKLYAQSALVVAILSFLLSVVAIVVMSRTLGVSKQLERLATGGAGLPHRSLVSCAAPKQTSEEGGVELQRMMSNRRGSTARRESFMSFAGDGDEPTKPRHRLSAHFEHFHGVSLENEGQASDDEGAGGGAGGADFNGDWDCVETFGLDEFLTAIKVGRLRRLAASKAPWPAWQFSRNGDDMTYVNRTKFGTMTEAFKIGGPEYSYTDLEKNTAQCKAYWKDDKKTALVIERGGKQGKTWETRTLKGDSLEFVLEMEGVAAKWGRKFTRSSK